MHCETIEKQRNYLFGMAPRKPIKNFMSNGYLGYMDSCFNT